MNQEEFQDLVERLSETPEIVRRLTDGLAVEDLRRKPSEKEFSMLENVCHLRDIEEEGYSVRIQKLINESRPFLPDLDGGKLARERDYNAQDLAAALRDFARARHSNMQTIRALPLEQLNRHGMFENTGTITLEKLLLLMNEHDEEHQKEMSDLRRTTARPEELRIL